MNTVSIIVLGTRIPFTSEKMPFIWSQKYKHRSTGLYIIFHNKNFKKRKNI